VFYDQVFLPGTVERVNAELSTNNSPTKSDLWVTLGFKDGDPREELGSLLKLHALQYIVKGRTEFFDEMRYFMERPDNIKAGVFNLAVFVTSITEQVFSYFHL
jgi:hypothetical protein